MLPPVAPGFKRYPPEQVGMKKGPTPIKSLGPSVLLGSIWKIIWWPRQESNLYLPLRRGLFCPLNHGAVRVILPERVVPGCH